MDSLFPKIRNPEFLYLVQRHATKVQKFRVKDKGPRYVRVFRNGQWRYESLKSLFHEYFFYFEQAKFALVQNYESKIAKHRAQLEAWEAELRAVQLTNEEDL